MPFDNIVSREDASDLIPEEVVGEIVQAAAQESAALALFRRVSMGSKISRMPVLSALASAYFVSGDTGLKQTTEMAWEGVVLEAEEIAAIVPVPEAVVDDAEFDLWGEIRPGLAEAVGVALDAAVFAGTNKPATWADALIPAAVAAGNVAIQGTASVEEGGIVGDIDSALDLVEEDGFDATALAARRSLRGLLRRARDTSGQRLADLTAGTVEGVQLAYVGGGVFDASTLALAGDFTMAVLGLRQDMTYKLLDQGVITDDERNIIYNLPQQDMVAMRVTFRAGFAVANPITREGADSEDPYPFAVLQAATASGGTGGTSGGNGGGS